MAINRSLREAFLMMRRAVCRPSQRGPSEVPGTNQDHNAVIRIFILRKGETRTWFRRDQPGQEHSAVPLQHASVRTKNISFDSLDPAAYQHLTGGSSPDPSRHSLDGTAPTCQGRGVSSMPHHSK
jgi:hypothetical protein